MKKSSAILPFAIPALALSMVSCEIQSNVTANTASIDDDAVIASADEVTAQKELAKAEQARERVTSELGALNAKIAGLEARVAELKTQGVSLNTYKSPGGSAASSSSPASTPITRAPAPVPTPAPSTEPAAPPEDAARFAQETASKEPAPAGEGGMMDLKTEFPIPMFVGTPVPVKLPNLEAPGKPKLTMPVPVGTKNVALGKPVDSSDPEPTIGDLDFVTDGDKDGGDGFFVELGFDLQWVQIDLEKEYDIHAIVVWHFHKAACAYFDVVVQISNDPDFNDGVTTVFNSDHDNTSGLGVGGDPAYIETNHGRIIDAKGTRGRYVRLYSNGNTANDLNHYIEVEVHATE